MSSFDKYGRDFTKTKAVWTLIDLHVIGSYQMVVGPFSLIFEWDPETDSTTIFFFLLFCPRVFGRYSQRGVAFIVAVVNLMYSLSILINVLNHLP